MILHSLVRVRDRVLAIDMIARNFLTDEEELEVHHVVNDDLYIFTSMNLASMCDERLDTNLEIGWIAGIPATRAPDNVAESRI